MVSHLRLLAHSAKLSKLFKHHQSVLTGHLKMMDMVRKHCVEGTGNYDTAKACVDRTHEMIRMFKQATWNFVSMESLLLKHYHIIVTHWRILAYSHGTNRAMPYRFLLKTISIEFLLVPLLRQCTLDILLQTISMVKPLRNMESMLQN